MRFSLLAFFLVTLLADTSLAGYPYNPANPRPDFFPHTFTNSIDSYRRTYNRPRYIGGWIANAIEPTSQEAMSWKDNVRAGIYGSGNATCINFYGYPKPWEKLNVGPRRNTTTGQASPMAVPSAMPLNTIPSDSTPYGTMDSGAYPVTTPAPLTIQSDEVLELGRPSTPNSTIRFPNPSNAMNPRR